MSSVRRFVFASLVVFSVLIPAARTQAADDGLSQQFYQSHEECIRDCVTAYHECLKPRANCDVIYRRCMAHPNRRPELCAAVKAQCESYNRQQDAVCVRQLGVCFRDCDNNAPI